MSIASGFSIQRNDVIQVPHRQQYESHDAISGDKIYLLRSLPDFEDKTWRVWNLQEAGKESTENLIPEDEICVLEAWKAEIEEDESGYQQS